MTRKPQPRPPTLLDALRDSLETAVRSPEGVERPAAVLWTDADGQWAGLMPALREALPQLYTLGSYEPAARTGPVIWLKCIVDRAIPEQAPPAGLVPILYLAGVGRQELRAGGDCPSALQPLIELQYRGCVWHQRNGRDWTVEAFLTSEDSLGLDIARDARTREAMLRALPLLGAEPIDVFAGRRLEAEDFDKLAIGDPVRDLLSWMSDPDAFRTRSDGSRREAFQAICRSEFGFDPERDGPQAAGTALLKGGSRWDEVWRRFCEAPQLYPGVTELLRQPGGDLFSDPSRRPGLNDEREDNLRRELGAIATLPHHEACARVLDLEEAHRERRAWVWARLDRSLMATALEPLARLARLAKSPLGGTSVAAMAADYAADGWRCDHAALQALAAVKGGVELAIVTKAVRALYGPWLDGSARRFQALAANEGDNLRALVSGTESAKDTCVLFVDGLRFDVARVLQDRLELRGMIVRVNHRLAPLPTVTATAKPMASPAHAGIGGGAGGDDFTPVIAATGQPAVAQRLRDEMARRGVEILDAREIRFATGGDAGAWMEIGQLDELGHSLNARLVGQIETEVDTIADHVAELLNVGYLRVRVVTDHGWLLLPGGLPKVELAPYLVATKWSRCAAVRGEPTLEMPTYPWHWDPRVRIASPPGMACFLAGNDYAHGGVSLQECVVPDMLVERGEQPVTASIAAIHWRGMRCRVTVLASASNLRVDLRLKYKDPASSIVASIKDIGEARETNLVVADDRHERSAATVVVIDASGRILDYKPTTVGEAE